MKNIFIIFNILFLLAGNILFPAIHYLHDHHDHHDHHLEHECEECLIIENNSNYIFDFHDSNLKLYKSSLFEYQNTRIVKFNLNKKYLTRAPPIF